MDTTKIYYYQSINHLDSVKTNIIEEIAKSNLTINKNYNSLKTEIKELKDTNSMSVWTPIIVALISACIGTLLAQLIDRSRKNKVEKVKELREVKSKCVNIILNLKESYRQLAMHKFHAQYWWYCHICEKDGTPDSEAYYGYHLNSQVKSQTVEEKIGELNALFFSELTKYERLKGINFNVDNEKELIENITFKKAKVYNKSMEYIELKSTHAETDERELRESYYGHLNVYKQILNKMD
jgi:hypothetical protein